MRELPEKLGSKPGTEVLIFFTTNRLELERRFDRAEGTLGGGHGIAPRPLRRKTMPLRSSSSLRVMGSCWWTHGSRQPS